MKQEPGPILTDKIIGLGIKVHRCLGPGLLESVYADCLAHELQQAGLQVRREVRIGLTYAGLAFAKCFIADAIVEDDVLLELKSVEHLLPVHEKQARTYLRFSGCRLASLMNFGAPLLRDGIRRYVASSTAG
jgi:GxxExxY protein